MRTRSERASRCGIRLKALLVMTLTMPAAGQSTTRVSVNSSGAQGNAPSQESSISADGRYVAFWSYATNLVAGDTNLTGDVFVRDRETGATELVSVDSAGIQGNDRSYAPSITADGRFVAFQSYATNLVAGDTNGFRDVFVHDRQTGVTERVSVKTNGVEGNEDSHSPSISADGRYVAFWSEAWNLVAGDTNQSTDVFVHDRQDGTTRRVSVDSAGTQGNDGSDYPSISTDGRYVAFHSHASNLVTGDTNGGFDVFVHDRQTGTTERVSVNSDEAQVFGWSRHPSISADGRHVAFESSATGLDDFDWNGQQDVFVRDRQLGTTEIVSRNSSGDYGNETSQAAAISADGRYVAYTSDATNLATGDTNDRDDVFVHDRELGTTERVSVDSSDAQGNDASFEPAISLGGRYVAFGSDAPNLVGDDTNGWEDVFIRDRGLGTKYCAATANSTGFSATIAASGSASSGAGDLRLSSRPVPNQNGIFFHGANPSQIPFGNGFLCTTSGIVRGAVVLGAANTATYVYDNSDVKHSLSAYVGSTRNFQHWFRDPAGGGSFFNTSNAISIGILP